MFFNVNIQRRSAVKALEMRTVFLEDNPKNFFLLNIQQHIIYFKERSIETCLLKKIIHNRTHICIICKNRKGGDSVMIKEVLVQE